MFFFYPLDRQSPYLCFNVFLLNFLMVINTANFHLASTIDCLTSPTRDVRPNTARAFDQRLSVKQKNKTPYKLA